MPISFFVFFLKIILLLLRAGLCFICMNPNYFEGFRKFENNIFREIYIFSTSKNVAGYVSGYAVDSFRHNTLKIGIYLYIFLPEKCLVKFCPIFSAYERFSRLSPVFKVLRTSKTFTDKIGMLKFVYGLRRPW